MSLCGIIGMGFGSGGTIDEPVAGILASPRGGISYAEHRLALTLANCTMFQLLTDTVGDAAAAFRHIHFSAWWRPFNEVYSAQEMIAMRPCAILFTEPNGYSTGSVASDQTWADEGSMVIDLEMNTPPELQSDAEMDRHWKNIVGSILGDERSDDPDFVGLKDLFGQAPDEEHSYLDGAHVQLGSYCRVYEAKQVVAQGDFLWARFHVRWGLRS